ncbi:hypothetical protein KFK09_019294 [Dendrobium nobile]|uniref:Uncharacterized protein n=1 Tax=Dendrobium nobile TaxID=94219 RepID=A0A8T3AWW3_DENNO|nr:hypothetical protein KFK09_019294 [Dendrobium nobile]
MIQSPPYDESAMTICSKLRDSRVAHNVTRPADSLAPASGAIHSPYFSLRTADSLAVASPATAGTPFHSFSSRLYLV